MYTLKIVVKEVLERTIQKSIHAVSEEEAKRILLDQIKKEYFSEKIVLDSEDFQEVIFDFIDID